MKRINWGKDWTVSVNGGQEQAIELPHDAMQQLGRDKDSATAHAGAYYRSGIYTYKKKFMPPADWSESDVILEIEGVYPNGKILLNGIELGRCNYGYLEYRFLMHDIIVGQENTLEVIVDHRMTPDSRWYSGGGLYRPVSLLIGGKTHIEPNGIKIKTVDYKDGLIEISVDYVLDASVKDAEVEVKSTFLYKGNEVTSGGVGFISIPNPKLWSADYPELYECRVDLMLDGKILDTETVTFGIRFIEWSAKGLFINGENTLLKGGCIHHDNGILGAREFKESAYRKIKKLKEAGFNAIRSAHNPMSRALLEACNLLGMYVMDEGWDMWYKPKSKFDYGTIFMENWHNDIKAIVDKDYNCPSVIMYSIGNEVTEPESEEGVKLGQKLINRFHELDMTRPVTAGINITLLMIAATGIDLTKNEEVKEREPKKDMNSTAFNEMVTQLGERMENAALQPQASEISQKILDALDIAGYNYASVRYEEDGKTYKDRVIVGTETYAHKLAKNWSYVERMPYLIGDFMWTAWDYLGETGIGAWHWNEGPVGFDKPYPWLLADTGAFDILGNDNAEAGNAAVIWGARTIPYIGVMPVNHPLQEVVKAIWRGTNAIPYWSYKGCDGNSAQIEVYSLGEEAELFVNDVSVGRCKLEDYKAVFRTEYHPGQLRAVAYDAQGAAIGESVLTSADSKTRIRIQPEEKLTDDDILYIDIDLVGENGEIECNADTLLTIRVENAELLAFGSADPFTREEFSGNSHSTYYGRAQAVVRGNRNDMKIIVSGEGLAEAVYIH